VAALDPRMTPDASTVSSTPSALASTTPDELPLARILEGGTWAAGRAVAAELRPGGPPPIRIRSDGTVF
jgi:uncharacterized protein DUF1688